MDLVTILALVLLVALILYALSGGADFGAGIWDLLASGPRRRRQRELIAASIAPIWEANHVWLILVLVVLFTGFPTAFAVVMTALHVPMTVLLVGIVLRGAAFAFRSHDQQDDATHRRWSTLFGMASWFTPFVLGACLGALASGAIRVQDGVLVSGFFAGWTEPFALACGAFAQGLFAFLAATYLTLDAQGEPELQQDFRRRATWAGLLLVPAAALVFVLAQDGARVIHRGLTDWWAPPLLAATALAAAVALAALWRRWFRTARIAAASEVALILFGWGLAQHPHVVVPDVTFAASAAARPTLELLVGALAVGAVVLLPSFVWLFVIFKGRDAAGPKDVPPKPH